MPTAISSLTTNGCGAAPDTSMSHSPVAPHALEPGRPARSRDYDPLEDFGSRGAARHASEIFPGDHDVEAAVRALGTCLPDPLAPFARLAYNYRWSWTPGAEEMFAAVDPERWDAV